MTSAHHVDPHLARRDAEQVETNGDGRQWDDFDRDAVGNQQRQNHQDNAEVDDGHDMGPFYAEVTFRGGGLALPGLDRIRRTHDFCPGMGLQGESNVHYVYRTEASADAVGSSTAYAPHTDVAGARDLVRLDSVHEDDALVVVAAAGQVHGQMDNHSGAEDGDVAETKSPAWRMVTHRATRTANDVGRVHFLPYDAHEDQVIDEHSRPTRRGDGDWIEFSWDQIRPSSEGGSPREELRHVCNFETS